MSTFYETGLALKLEELQAIRAVLAELPYDRVAPLIKAIDSGMPVNYEYLGTSPESILVNVLFRIGAGELPIHHAIIHTDGVPIEIDDAQVSFKGMVYRYDKDMAPGEIADILVGLLDEQRQAEQEKLNDPQS